MAQDDKPFRWPGEPANDADVNAETLRTGEPDVLRNWLSRGPVKRRRSSFDPNLYTWKGYRQWKADVNKQWVDPDE
ncbi:MAG: hypothetical protein AAF578_13360 [Pseudomonadota bacterium]